jgi:hypothetical protein
LLLLLLLLHAWQLCTQQLKQQPFCLNLLQLFQQLDINSSCSESCTDSCTEFCTIGSGTVRLQQALHFMPLPQLLPQLLQQVLQQLLLLLLL